jgi:hypothetical protein
MPLQYNSSEQIIQWFRDEYRKGTLVIKPPFQRKPVWGAKQKCYLIESILLNMPIPEIYIQRVVSSEGEVQYALVDGQQRIRTVLQFLGSDLDPKEQEHNQFILDKLKDDSPWKNLSFADLSGEEKISFYNYAFAVRFLRTNDDQQVRDIFRRLNEFQSELKPQELRNAIYGGPFVRLAEKFADDDYWAENRIISAALIRRMNDIEFMSELLVGIMHGPQGGSAKDLNEYYERYEDYEDEFPGQREAKKLFETTLTTIKRVLPDIKETRWSNKTDFYSLFVAVGTLLRTSELPVSAASNLKRTLLDFGEKVSKRLADENARVNKNVASYVRAVEKGANDKKRRADRHLALLDEVKSYFKDTTK